MASFAEIVLPSDNLHVITLAAGDPPCTLTVKVTLPSASLTISPVTCADCVCITAPAIVLVCMCN